MAEYREELINSVDTQSSEILQGVSQVDVTSSGNYTASWMEQDKPDNSYDTSSIPEPEPLPLDTRFDDYAVQNLQQDIVPDFAALDMPEVQVGELESPLPRAADIPTPKLEPVPQASSVERLVEKLDEPEAFVPELTKTQEKVQARRDALLKRQGFPRQPPEEAQGLKPEPVPNVSQTSEPVKNNPTLNPQPQVQSPPDVERRRESLRERQSRSQDPAFDMEIGETNETRQPNFRAASTSMNAAVNDFATTVADQFEDQARALAMAAARIRVLEQIVREAMR